MFGKKGRKNALDIIFRLSGLLGTVSVHLSSLVPSGAEADWDIGDFTECTFPGYNAISGPTFAAPDLDGSNRGRIVSNTLTWTAGTIITPETIRAIWVQYRIFASGLDYFLWGKAISPTVTMSETGQEFKRVLTFLDNDFTP